MSFGELSGLPSNASAMTVMRAVVLPAHDAAVEILAGQLAALEVEGIAVGVVGRFAERGHPAVVPEVAVLHVAADIAEYEVLALARPGRPLGPLRAGPQPVEAGIARHQAAERRVDDEHVGVGIDRRVALVQSRGGLLIVLGGVPTCAFGGMMA